jgi:hypothetical protein
MALSVRRIVADDSGGKAVIISDETIEAVSRGIGHNITGCEMWSTNHMLFITARARLLPEPADRMMASVAATPWITWSSGIG